MNVLALDLSLSATGVADAVGTRTIKPTTTGVERLGEIRDAVLGAAKGWQAYPTAPIGRPDLIAIEGYSYGSPNQAHQLGELGGVVRLALWEAGLAWIVVPPAKIKAYATGRGNAGKAEVLTEAVRRLDYAGFDDNCADALMLRALVLDALGHPIVAMPQTHRKAIDSVRLLLKAQGFSVEDAA